MTSVDLRTRTDADIRAVDAAAFFADQLPEFLDANAALVSDGAHALAPRPIVLTVEGRSWTLALAGGTIRLTEGSHGAAELVLTAEEFSDLVCDVRTVMGLFTGGDLRMPAGRLEDALDWGVILRGLIDARALHTPGAVTFGDLDLHHTFTLDDPAEDMGAFLATAGFLHVAGVYEPGEMAQVSDEIDAALPTYHPDDGQSWWARTAAGEHRCVRLQSFQERSPTTSELLSDARLLALGHLTDDEYDVGEHHLQGNVIEALVKPIGVVQGISDVPWHKDCSLGRHSYRCCSLTVGISVTGADETSGQLRVVAGSHRALIQPAFVRRDLDLPQIDLPTATGDVTVHLSCTLHMSQPPVDRERRVMYTGFSLARRGSSTAASAHADKTLQRIREQSYKTVSQVPAV